MSYDAPPPPPPPGVPPPPPPPGVPPPPPPGGYGAMPAGYGGAVPMNNGAGTTALITGILSLLCCPVILSIVAIIYGRKGMALADAGQANNRGMAQAGFVLGIVSLVLVAVGLIISIATGGWSFKVGS